MNIFIKPGKTMTYTAPAGGVTSGVPVIVGGMLVVPTNTVAAGLPFEAYTMGVFLLAKTANEGALVEGQPVYWDVANAKFTIDPSVGLPIGSMAAAALTGDLTGQVRFNMISVAGRTLVLRKRVTIAQVNAGATLIPALPGIKLRMIDEQIIAIGGAAGAVTTVDILATQAAAGVKLVAHAQVALTRSSLLRAGDANSAILADGASFMQNDVNTAITIGKTGAAVTTATNFDVQIEYQLE